MNSVLEKKQAAAAKARAVRALRYPRPGERKYSRLSPTEAIDPNKIYPFALCPELLGISRFTLQKAQANGLQVRKLGSRKFVTGAELQRFLGASPSGLEEVSSPFPLSPAELRERTGVVSAFEAYTVRELAERFGFGPQWLEQARQQGLKLVPLGREEGVLGSTLIEFLKTQER